jgi:hypothetical protein
MVDESEFFNRCEVGQKPLLEFQLDRQYNDAILYSGEVLLDWECLEDNPVTDVETAAERLMSAAERFGQAHNFLSLPDGVDQERLITDLYIELFRLDEGQSDDKTLLFGGTRSVSFN